MNLIASIVAAVATPLFSWFVSFFTRKLVTIGTMIAAFVLLTAAFVSALKVIITAVLAMAFMPVWIVSSVGLFMPSNFVAVLSSIAAAHSCRWAYDKAMDKVRLINSAV